MPLSQHDEVQESFSTPVLHHSECVIHGDPFVGKKRSCLGIWNPFTKDPQELAPSPLPTILIDHPQVLSQCKTGDILDDGLWHCSCVCALKLTAQRESQTHAVHSWEFIPDSHLANLIPIQHSQPHTKTYKSHRNSRKIGKIWHGFLIDLSDIPRSCVQSGHFCARTRQEVGVFMFWISQNKIRENPTQRSLRFFAPRRSMTKPKRPKYETVSWAAQSWGDSFRGYNSGGEST